MTGSACRRVPARVAGSKVGNTDDVAVLKQSYRKCGWNYYELPLWTRALCAGFDPLAEYDRNNPNRIVWSTQKPVTIVYSASRQTNLGTGACGMRKARGSMPSISFSQLNMNPPPPAMTGAKDSGTKHASAASAAEWSSWSIGKSRNVRGRRASALLSRSGANGSSSNASRLRRRSMPSMKLKATAKPTAEEGSSQQVRKRRPSVGGSVLKAPKLKSWSGWDPTRAGTKQVKRSGRASLAMPGLQSSLLAPEKDGGRSSMPSIKLKATSQAAGGGRKRRLSFAKQVKPTGSSGAKQAWSGWSVAAKPSRSGRNAGRGSFDLGSSGRGASLAQDPRGSMPAMRLQATTLSIGQAAQRAKRSTAATVLSTGGAKWTGWDVVPATPTATTTANAARAPTAGRRGRKGSVDSLGGLAGRGEQGHTHAHRGSVPSNMKVQSSLPYASTLRPPLTQTGSNSASSSASTTASKRVEGVDDPAGRVMAMRVERERRVSFVTLPPSTQEGEVVTVVTNDGHELLVEVPHADQGTAGEELEVHFEVETDKVLVPVDEEGQVQTQRRMSFTSLVQIPADASLAEGDSFVAQTEDGVELQVEVPENLGPGDELAINYDLYEALRLPIKKDGSVPLKMRKTRSSFAVVPQGVHEGQMLQVHTPAGVTEVEVPTGVQEGEEFEVEYEVEEEMAVGVGVGEGDKVGQRPRATRRVRRTSFVLVPEGVAPGQSVALVMPTGHEVEAEVPAGVHAGEEFEVVYEVEQEVAAAEDLAKGTVTALRTVAKRSSVTVQAGMRGGDLVPVETEHGTVDLRLPESVRAGEVIELEYEAQEEVEVALGELDVHDPERHGGGSGGAGGDAEEGGAIDFDPSQSAYMHTHAHFLGPESPQLVAADANLSSLPAAAASAQFVWDSSRQFIPPPNPLVQFGQEAGRSGGGTGVALAVDTNDRNPSAAVPSSPSSSSSPPPPPPPPRSPNLAEDLGVWYQRQGTSVAQSPSVMMNKGVHEVTDVMGPLPKPLVLSASLSGSLPYTGNAASTNGSGSTGTSALVGARRRRGARDRKNDSSQVQVRDPSASSPPSSSSLRHGGAYRVGGMRGSGSRRAWQLRRDKLYQMQAEASRLLETDNLAAAAAQASRCIEYSTKHFGRLHVNNLYGVVVLAQAQQQSGHADSALATYQLAYSLVQSNRPLLEANRLRAVALLACLALGHMCYAHAEATKEGAVGTGEAVTGAEGTIDMPSAQALRVLQLAVEALDIGEGLLELSEEEVEGGFTEGGLQVLRFDPSEDAHADAHARAHAQAYAPLPSSSSQRPKPTSAVWHPEFGQLHLLKGRVHRALGGYEASRRHIALAVAGYERRFGLEHLLTARALQELGAAEQLLGRPHRALVNYLRCHPLFERLLAGASPAPLPTTAAAAVALEPLYMGMGGCLLQMHQGVGAADADSSGDPSLYQTLLSQLGSQSHADAAVVMFERSKQLREQLLGVEHVGTTEPLLCLGDALRARSGEGDDEVALEFYEQARQVRTQVLGANHEKVAVCLLRMGDLHSARSGWPEALRCYSGATSSSAHLGSRHPVFISSAARQASVLACGAPLDALGGATGGESLSEDAGIEGARVALQLYNSILPFCDAERNPLMGGANQLAVAAIHNDVGGVLRQLLQDGDALKHYAQSLALYTRCCGRDYLEAATVHNNIGSVYLRMAWYGEARHHYTRARVIRERALGALHPSTAQCYRNLAIVHLRLGQVQAALGLLRKEEGAVLHLASLAVEHRQGREGAVEDPAREVRQLIAEATRQLGQIQQMARAKHGPAKEYDYDDGLWNGEALFAVEDRL